MKGLILQSLSGYYDVLASGIVYRTRARGNFRKRRITPLVGDQVEFKPAGVKEGYLLEIAARKNSLVRPPVANVDAAIVVVSCKQPNFSANLLDRQLVMLEAQKIKSVIYFSKKDLLSDQELKGFMHIFAAYACYPVFEDSVKLQEYLQKQLKKQILVVMGQTGAGKSTLLNKFDATWKLPTGEVSKALSRGKHTTRKVALMAWKNNYIADTPGFSSFELQNLDSQNLRQLFPDFWPVQNNCKFRGCLHQNEPHCAVKAAVAAKKIAASRYQSYLQFLEELQQKKPKYNR
ncbi:ribosome small subunit-dependent GTPase A [Liquorilactobacillus sicerae]|uniref:ribosome small subunit-dependent GTPase A n=1 Tax=Liquorilactobacillus sicerae TaxID=1416943 RepID=UPI0024808A72|nr:ribosome small subunit-dependent GTPase A [Liquorilactobacillus sicerae]